MSNNRNALDISVLRNNPTEFLLGCQRIIHICVKQYIASGMFDPEDEQDMVQTVNEELIMKLPAIDAQYNGMAHMQTYISAIIQNICLKIQRESYKIVKTAPLHTAATHLSNDPSNDIIIHQELQRFHSIVQLLYRKKFREMFFVRLYLGIDMKATDIRDVIHRITTPEREMLSETVIKNYHTLNITQRFERMAVVFNKYRTKKKVSTLALKHWTERHIDRFIRLLNGNPPVRFYTEESLKVLIEEYYIRKTENN